MSIRIPVVLSLLLVSSLPALADRLDGGWCGGGGKQIRINGPEITLPSGKVMQGDYRRHTFDYISPAGESDAGTKVRIQQLNDEQMQLYRSNGGTTAEPELWQRCDMTS